MLLARWPTMIDKILREKYRVERELVGTAHPLIVTSLTVRRANGDVVTAQAPRENPLTHQFPPRLTP